LIVRQFFKSAIGLWAAKDYLDLHEPIRSLSDLQGHKLIRMLTNLRGLVLHEGNVQLDLNSLSHNLQVDDMLTCQAFAENGLGIAVLPLFGQNHFHGATRLVRVLPHVQTEEVTAYFLHPRHNIIPPTVTSFIEMATQVFDNTTV
jgi:DNA-binding transcriptional LysR family regulator